MMAPSNSAKERFVGQGNDLPETMRCFQPEQQRHQGIAPHQIVLLERVLIGLSVSTSPAAIATIANSQAGQ